ERARRRIQQHERDQQGDKALAERGDPQRHGEQHAPAQDDRAPVPDVAQHAEHRFHCAAEQARDAEQQPDLGVGQREIAADVRPRGLARAEDQLIQKLDQQERRDQTRGAARPDKTAAHVWLLWWVNGYATTLITTPLVSAATVSVRMLTPASANASASACSIAA